MTRQHIACVEDIVRPRELLGAFPTPLFTLVSEPIRQATRQHIHFAPGTGIPPTFAPTFDWATFTRLAFTEEQTSWEALNFSLPLPARQYLRDCIPANSLLLAVEMPAWFSSLCTEFGISYLDMRVSPLRFARDFYIALDTNDTQIHERIRSYAIFQEEVSLEAAALSASVRKLFFDLEKRGQYSFDMDNTLVYIGQTSFDAAIIGPDGRHLRCQDFADRLQSLTTQTSKRLLYKPHPYDDGFATEERQALEAITGRSIPQCLNNSYQLLGSTASVEFISISSGLLQEALFFGKTVHWLHKPHVPLAYPDDVRQEGHFLQVHFENIQSPGFWHQILMPEKPAPRLSRLPTLAPNYGRELLDTWWDYSKHKIWQRTLPIESFERSGGGLLRNRIEALEQSLGNLFTAQINNNIELPKATTVAPETESRWKNLDPQHLKELTDPQEAAALFKHSVHMVEIEVSSYCNRKCWFCPNSTYDRMSENKLMPADMYSSILRQLASISYDGTITYSRYNEPLADKMILERIAEARRMLPNTQLHTNTNGDYLDLEYIEQLYAVGLRSLNIQIYLPNKERYNHEKIKAAGDKILKRVQLPHTLVRDTPGEWYEKKLHYRDMAIRLYGRNFETGGTSRGGEVPIHLDYQRTSPCLIPFWAVYIDHDGSTVPCCNLRSDIPAHESYVIGRLAQQPDLFLQYTNRFAANFRTSLITDGVKKGLCSNCHYAEEQPSQEQTKQLADLLATRIG